MILYKKVPGKKSSYSGKRMGTKDVYNHGKNGQLILKTPGWLYSKYRCVKKPFYENVLYLTSFSQDLGIFFSFFFFFPVILFPETLFTADPNSILGKKRPKESKTQDFISMRHFFQSFISRCFSEIFFPGTFLNRFNFICRMTSPGRSGHVFENCL